MHRQLTFKYRRWSNVENRRQIIRRNGRNVPRLHFRSQVNPQKQLKVQIELTLQHGRPFDLHVLTSISRETQRQSFCFPSQKMLVGHVFNNICLLNQFIYMNQKIF